MKYLRAKHGGVTDWFNGNTTEENELLTPNERNRKYRYLFDSEFEEVEISRKNIYITMSGKRFEYGTGPKRAQIKGGR